MGTLNEGSFRGLVAALAVALLVHLPLVWWSRTDTASISAVGETQTTVWVSGDLSKPSRSKTVLSNKHPAEHTESEMEPESAAAANASATPSGSVGGGNGTAADPYLRRVFETILEQPLSRPDTHPLDEAARVEIEFSIEPDGKITDVILARSSTFASFDSVALAAVRDVQQVDPVPTSLLQGRDSLRLRLPIRFEATSR